METSNMTPLQKLVHASELFALADTAANPDDFQIYKAKLADTLADVIKPPANLVGDVNPQAWAETFASYFATITPEAAYSWFSVAILAGYKQGQTEGEAQGREKASNDASAGFKEMGSLLAFIRAGADSGRIRSPQLTDPLDKSESGIASTLSEMISRRLQLAGLE